MKKEFNTRLTHYSSSNRHSDYNQFRGEAKLAGYDNENKVALELTLVYDDSVSIEYIEELANKDLKLTIENNSDAIRIKELEDTVKKLKAALQANINTINKVM